MHFLSNFVFFSASCADFSPVFEKAATELAAKGVSVAKVNCEEQPELCQRVGVPEYPHVALFVDGKQAALSASAEPIT